MITQLDIDNYLYPIIKEITDKGYAVQLWNKELEIVNDQLVLSTYSPLTGSISMPLNLETLNECIKDIDELLKQCRVTVAAKVLYEWMQRK